MSSLLHFAFLAALASACFAQQPPVYQDAAAPIESRAGELVSRMTVGGKQPSAEAPADLRLNGAPKEVQ